MTVRSAPVVREPMNVLYPKAAPPDAFPAPPMVDARQSVATWQARTVASARRPSGLGLAYTQLPGSASQAAFAGDGSLWVLSTNPSGPDKYIYHYVGGTYTNVPGLASRLAPTPNGTLYAINSAGFLYRYTTFWSGLGGQSKDVAVGNDGTIYVISATSAPDGAIYRNTTGVWGQLPGSGARLASTPDTNLYVVTSTGAIYQTPLGSIAYTRCPGAATRVEPIGSGTFIALGSPLDVVNGSGLYQFQPANSASCAGGSYMQLDGAGVDVSATPADLVVLSAAGGIYGSPIGQTTATTPPLATPPPASVPTTPPTPDPSSPALSASWYGNGSFNAAGPIVSVPGGALSAEGGVIAFTANGQTATIVLGLAGTTTFTYLTGSFSSADPPSCGLVTIVRAAPNAFTVSTTGPGANCAVFLYGAKAGTGPYIVYSITGAVALGGTVQ